MNDMLQAARKGELVPPLPARISLEPGDPGYSPAHPFVRIYLDGVEQRECVMADTKEGVVKRTLIGRDGKFIIENNSVLYETVRGHVTMKRI